MSFETGIAVSVDSRGARQGAAEVNRAFDSMASKAQGTVRGIEGRFESLKNSLFSLRTLVTTLGAAFAAREYVQAADTYKLIEARLRLVTSSSQELARVQGELFNVAQRTRASFEGTAELFARVSRSSQELGISNERLLKITETVQQAIVASGASAQEASAGLIQFAQGLASGALRGDELRSVMEQMPRLAKAIADGMGITIGQLRRMGEEGELSATKVLSAIEGQAPKIASEFAQIPTTVRQALQTAQNSFLKFFGEVDKAAGLTDHLSAAIQAIADKFSVTGDDAQAMARKVGEAILDFVRRAILGIADVIDTIKPLFMAVMAGVNDVLGFWNSLPQYVREMGLIGALFLGVKGTLIAGVVVAIMEDLDKRSREILQKNADALHVPSANINLGTGEVTYDNKAKPIERKSLDEWVRGTFGGEDGAKISLFGNDASGGSARQGAEEFLAKIDEIVARINEAKKAAEGFNNEIGKGGAQVFLTKEEVSQLDEFVKKIDPVAGRIREVEKATNLFAKALEAGAIDQERYVELLEAMGRANQAFEAHLNANVRGLQAQAKEMEVANQIAELSNETNWLTGEISLENKLRIIDITKAHKLETLAMERKLSIMEAMPDQIDAINEAYDRMEAAITRATDIERTKAFRDQFKPIEETIKNAIRGIQDAFADAFEKIFSGGVKKFSDLANVIKQVMIKAAAQIAAAMVFNPQMLSGGGGGGGGLLSMFGLGGSPGGTTVAGGGTDFFGLARSGLSLGNNTGLFGDTFSGIGSSITSGLDTFGASLGFSSVNGGANTLYGLAGVESGAIDAGFIAGEGALSGASFSSVLGGAGAGFAAGTLLNSLVGGKETGGMVGSAVGAVAGAIIGSIIPGIGTLIGGLIGGSGGGLIGGLFGPGPGFSGATGKVGIDEQGRAFNSGAVGKRYNLGQASSATDQFVQTINTAMSALGLKFGAQATSYFTGLGFGGGSVPIERNVTSLLGYGDVKSGDSALDAKIKSYFAKEYDTPSGESADALLQSLSDIVGLHKLFTENDNPLVPEKLSQVAQAIKAIGDAFDEIKPKAEKFGYSLTELEAMRVKAIDDIRTGFNESITDQILAFTDPVQLALRELTRAQEARLKEAKDAGADLVQVERLAGIERQKVIEQFSNQATNTFRDMLNAMLGGSSSPLAPGVVLANAESRFNSVRTAALGGDTQALAALPQAATDLLAASRTMFASSEMFFQRFNFVTDTLRNLIGDTPGFAAGGEFTVPGGMGGIDSRFVRIRANPGERVRVSRAGQEDQAFVNGRENARYMTENNDLLRALVAKIDSLETTVARQQAALDRLTQAPANRKTA